MSKLKTYIVTTIGWLLGIVWTIILVAIAFLAYALEPFNGTLLHKVLHIWGWGISNIGCTSIIIEGRENIDPNKSYVFLSNHASMFDIYILSAVIPNDSAFLSKTSVFFVPFLGILMYLNGCIPINRKNPKKALKSIEKVKKNLQKGISMIIFPEGTRSEDGSVGPFKTGSLRALEAGQMEVVPITLCGTETIMQKGSFLVHRGHVKVIFHRPVLSPPTGAGKKEMRNFLETIRETIIDGKKRCQ